MEHLAALMLIVSCGNTPDSCEVYPSPVVGYETEQACEQDIAPVLGQVDRRAGLVIARCLSVDPADDREMEIVWNVTDDGRFEAAVKPVEGAPADESGPMVAQAARQDTRHVLR
ncbi:hypothetical protein CSC94_02810 [Zhengella mangrovi]|uniref:Uncharacterized protein n=1 Tax=Zhengella mangrovi TaxID=1982044 RepID=A0A2G1QTS9_9HYPH|nr:hypothetical protein [Zhengella mangrovi]PHP68933.1 hypothetical protein CSC94_02810 [Zhengella mangrovi]